MPITVYATDGVLSETAQKQAFAALTSSVLKLHQLVGNRFMTPNVIGEVSIIPKGRSFAAGRPENIVIVELKLPSFGLASQEQKEAFVSEATDVIVQASGGRQPRERIYVNMVYAVDGLWGIGGKAYTNADLLDAVSKAAL